MAGSAAACCVQVCLCEQSFKESCNLLTQHSLPLNVLHVRSPCRHPAGPRAGPLPYKVAGEHAAAGAALRAARLRPGRRPVHGVIPMQLSHTTLYFWWCLESSDRYMHLDMSTLVRHKHAWQAVAKAAVAAATDPAVPSGVMDVWDIKKYEAGA